MSPQAKPATTLDEQIRILGERGMELDEATAQQWLRSVGYYRLSGYWYPYRRLKGGDRLDSFESGTCFNDVVKLYEFDRKMRSLLFDALERVEVLLRSTLCEFIVKNGPLAYRESMYYDDSFDHRGWLSKVKKRIDRAKRRNQAIVHYKEVHSGVYPFWVVTEVLDFTDVSKLYSGLRPGDQEKVAQSLGIDVNISKLKPERRKKYGERHPFASWCEQLTVVRNTCAHHSRLWNRSFIPASTSELKDINGLESLPDVQGQSESLYGVVIMLAFLLRTASPGSSWIGKVRCLVEESYMPLTGSCRRSLEEMGFPKEWDKESVWN